MNNDDDEEKLTDDEEKLIDSVIESLAERALTAISAIDREMLIRGLSPELQAIQWRLIEAMTRAKAEVLEDAL